MTTLYDTVYIDGKVCSKLSAYDGFFSSTDVMTLLEKISVALSSMEQKQVFPALPDIFKALELTPSPRVIILGQDPYHNPGSAMGLCFSVPSTCKKINPSLRNIQKEVKSCGYTVNGGDLSGWALQGVLMLNSSLSVEMGKPNSHKKLWKAFIEKLLLYISSHFTLVWMLWGKDAHMSLPSLPSTCKHLIIKSSHPSPLSATRYCGSEEPFLGGGAGFRTCNKWLADNGLDEINWDIS